ncbi:MAG TPA: hypothetical protein VFI15_08190 [Candidatus Limnocylindrales bacterium]|nr:hypothetical protein [Candidatus Limnocylindrales bacterium]
MQRLLQVVLSAWREAERVASERPDASREHAAALIAADRLKGLYGELVASAKADDDRDAVESAATSELGTSI